MAARPSISSLRMIAALKLGAVSAVSVVLVAGCIRIVTRERPSGNAHRDGGDRQRKSQRNLGQHGHSPRVEARIGFRELDRGTRRLFPRSHSNGVRSVQVLVCSGKCADHIGVIRLCNRTSRAVLVGCFALFDTSSARRGAKSITLLSARGAVWRLLCSVKNAATTERLVAPQRRSLGRYRDFQRPAWWERRGRTP